jgi:hypothetical protein
MKLPFDIQAENIMPYDPSDLEDFAKRLKPRLMTAIRQANQSRMPMYQMRKLAEFAGTN